MSFEECLKPNGFNSREYFQEFSYRTGVSKTVYSLFYPEVRKIKNNFYQCNYDDIIKRHDRTWTKRQDDFHDEFFEKWIEWSSPVLQIYPSMFPNYYPTAGSSEGIRDSIRHISKNEGTIIVFNGEYEGYEAFAKAHDVPLIKISRSNWMSDVDKKIGNNSNGKGYWFFLSHPSSIDGNVWNDYDNFMTYLSNRYFACNVALDLCYVGCVAKEYKIDITYPVIKMIFISMSKSFGVYYDRIGGVFSNIILDGIWGNKWFKNLTSLEMGCELMNHIGVYDLPRKYRKIQKSALDEINKTMEWNATSSDVIILSTEDLTNKICNLDQEYLKRLDNMSRLCLTPSMDKIINGEIE